MPVSKKRKPKKGKRPNPRPQAPVQTKSAEPSPPWYVATMTGLMVVGVLLVLVRFIFNLDYLLLVFGLALIGAGFLMTTNYR